MRWRKRFQLSHFRIPPGEEIFKADAVGIDDLFDCAEAHSQHASRFKTLVILESNADQIGGLLLA